MTDYAELRAAVDAVKPGDGDTMLAYRLASGPTVIRALLAEMDALIHDNAEYVGAASALATENQRLREALDIARDFVAEALAQERDAYRGHESVSSIADIERYLAQIDAALAQGQS